MSSHREAPEISKDPAADNTDLYAFVSPDRVEAVHRLGKGLISLVLRDGVAVPVGPTYVKTVQARLGVGLESLSL